MQKIFHGAFTARTIRNKQSDGRFEGMPDEWLDFIAECRSGKTHKYDIVEGPMANDTVWNYVNDFMSGNITRKTENKRGAIVNALGKDGIIKQIKDAEVNHCLSFEQVSDEVIEQYIITNGNFDTITGSKYRIPGFQDIRKLYSMMIADCAADDHFAVAHALMSPKIEVKAILAEHYGDLLGPVTVAESAKLSYEAICKLIKSMGRIEKIILSHP